MDDPHSVDMDIHNLSNRDPFPRSVQSCKSSNVRCHRVCPCGKDTYGINLLYPSILLASNMFAENLRLLVSVIAGLTMQKISGTLYLHTKFSAQSCKNWVMHPEVALFHTALSPYRLIQWLNTLK